MGNETPLRPLEDSIAVLERSLGEMADLVSDSLLWAKEYLATGGKLTYRDNTRMLQTLLAHVGPLALMLKRLRESDGQSPSFVPQIEGLSVLVQQARIELQRREGSPPVPELDVLRESHEALLNG